MFTRVVQVVYYLQERDFLKTFKIPGKVFLNFLRTLEDHYLQGIVVLSPQSNDGGSLFQMFHIITAFTVPM